MLAKKNRLVKQTDFSAVYTKGTYAASGVLAIKYLRSNLKVVRIGFPISKKFSKKATERNRARRILREAARFNLATLKPGFDIVIMPKPGLEKNNSVKTADILNSIFKKAKLII